MSSNKGGKVPLSAHGGIVGQIFYLQDKVARLEKLVAVQSQAIDMIQAQVSELVDAVINRRGEQ